MNCCANPGINDFSYSTYVHKYCTRCGSHLYEGRIISKSDWSDWIEHGDDGEGYSEFRARVQVKRTERL